MSSWKTTIDSPLGPLRAFATDNGLRALLLQQNDIALYGLPPDSLERPEHPLFARLEQQMHQYFEGQRREFDLPLDPVGTEFQRLAWDALCAIPYGSTRTYAQQAAAIGRPQAARAVGAANGRNAISIVVPCHRVVGADGKLTGYAGGMDVKRFLLDHEGARSRPS